MAISQYQQYNYEEDCTSLVDISISCTGLLKRDVFSKSDPFCILLLREGRSYREVGRTEMIKNIHEPVFKKPIRIRYKFEEEQIIKFSVEDYDSPTKSESLGSVIIRLAEVASNGQSMSYDLKCKSKPAGKITITAEEVMDAKTKVRFTIVCNNLDKKDFIGKSDPYLVISKIREGGRTVQVYKSSVIKSTLNPEWKPFDIDMSTLCSGDHSSPILFTVYDWNSKGTPDLIGSFQTTFNEINPDAGNMKEFFLINETIRKKKGSKYKHSGVFTIKNIQLIQINTFLEHLKGGLQVELMVAVDFTGSNGNPADPRSLHYTGGGSDNEYVDAIKSVGSVLAPYDSDQMIPALGFGAKLPPDYSQAHHCFHLNCLQNPDVFQVEGILDAYRKTLSIARLSGPTLFSEVINLAQSIASSQLNSYAYTILLIITDGVINDMTNTIDLIVDSSKLPLSIVIVGVGGADFTDMRTLDADDIPLKHSKSAKTMSRDIVQFVSMRECKKEGSYFSLAKQVLAEIPTQVMSYMDILHILPRPPAPRMFKLQAMHSMQSMSEYPPQAAPGYPPQAGYPPQPGYYPQTAPGYAPQPGYPPQSGYPPQLGTPQTIPGYQPQNIPGYPAQPVPGYPDPAHPAPGYPPQTEPVYPPLDTLNIYPVGQSHAPEYLPADPFVNYNINDTNTDISIASAPPDENTQ